MSSDDEDRAAPKRPPKPADREAKLAEALRANLRRRKAEPRPPPSARRGPEDGDST